MAAQHNNYFGFHTLVYNERFHKDIINTIIEQAVMVLRQPNQTFGEKDGHLFLVTSLRGINLIRRQLMERQTSSLAPTQMSKIGMSTLFFHLDGFGLSLNHNPDLDDLDDGQIQVFYKGDYIVKLIRL